jgi:hypothetical protein
MVVHLSHTQINTHATSHLTLFFQLGRLTHFAFDAVLVSAFLAGVKRSTGLTYVSRMQLTMLRIILT